MSFQLNSFCANKGSILGKPFLSVKFEVKLSKDDKGCWLVMVGQQIICISIFKNAFPVLLGNQDFAFQQGTHGDSEK